MSLFEEPILVEPHVRQLRRLETSRHRSLALGRVGRKISLTPAEPEV